MTSELLTDYQRVRVATESLAAPLSPEDQTVQSMPDVSPTKWHRAHTTWFFETFVLGSDWVSKLLDDPPGVPFDPTFGRLFNSYYEAAGPRFDRDRRGVLSRPGVARIAEYRQWVDDAMARVLTEAALPSDLLDLVTLGLHHEQQHQELMLMDIKHVLSCHPDDAAYGPVDELAWWRAAPAFDRPVGWIDSPGGLVEVGHRGDGFGFDNEFPRHRQWLEPFAVADRPVTIGDWLAFIDDGGYRRPELWLAEGWAVVQQHRWDAPLYWSWDPAQGWSAFTLAGHGPVVASEPVRHVSFFEADAFARWSGARLPTEAEWEYVASTRSSAELARDGFIGAVWQWTASSYSPYPGFHPAAGAVGEYNGKFMVNQQVLRGSSAFTPPGHARTTYRNFFPASARWAVSGLRLARS